MKAGSLGLEGLTEEPLDPVSLYGSAALARDAQPEAGAFERATPVLGPGERWRMKNRPPYERP